MQNLFQVYRPLLHRWTLYENTDSRAYIMAREDDGNLVVWDMEDFARASTIADDKTNE